MAARRTPPRETLTRERVLDAAMAMADESGVESLSMRTLGQRLGVEAMSLYNHVANKDDVLDAILDRAVAEITPAAPTGEWRAAIRASALSANEALSRHSWACGMWLQRPPGPARARYMEGLLSCLERSRLPHDIAHHAYHVIDTYIVGYTAQQRTFVMGADQLQDAADRFVSQLPPEEFPNVLAHIRAHIEGESTGSAFGFGLDLILDGLRRLQRSK